MKLLITDDQNSVHMFFDRMLHYEELGITQVFHATNGEEALKIIKEEWPELMLLDIRMPVMDGLSLLEVIQDLPFEHRVMILSAFDEFEYAKKCMRFGVRDYLLKPIDIREVKKSLEQSMKEISELQKKSIYRTFQRYMDGTADGTEYVPEELEKQGYGIVCFESGNVPEFRMKPVDECERVKGAEENLQGKTEGFWQSNSERQYDAVKTFCEVEVEDLEIRIYEARNQQEWERFYAVQKDKNPDMRIGFGLFHLGKEQFRQAFTESLEALRQSFYRPGTYYYERGSLTLYQGTEAQKLSEQLKKSFETGNIQEMKQAVEKLFFIFKRGNVHPDYVQDFCYGFLIQINSDFVETLKKLRSSAVMEAFRSVDAAGVKNMFLRLMLSMRLDLSPKDVQMDEDVVRKIRHYIDTNYEKDISLTTLSKHFFISKYQISRLFKKQFEINYSDYILKVRMEAAEMMLMNSKEKIDDIARRSGFEETSYFSRVFSKYFGMSPGEYRKKKGEGYGEKTVL